MRMGEPARATMCSHAGKDEHADVCAREGNVATPFSPPQHPSGGNALEVTQGGQPRHDVEQVLTRILTEAVPPQGQAAQTREGLQHLLQHLTSQGKGARQHTVVVTASCHVRVRVCGAVSGLG